MNRMTFLARIRAAVDVANATPKRLANSLGERLAKPPHHPLPICAKVPRAEREAQFIRKLEARGAVVLAVPELSTLPEAVAPFVGGDTGPLLLGDDARLTSLPWTVPTQIWNPEQKPEDGTAALTHAQAAIAETGTLLFGSGAASPATLAFLAETHIAAVARSTIFGSLEDAFADLASRAPDRFPRAVNLISSPSRTGDIGGRIVEGAHGPRTLVVVLYGAPADA